MSPHSRRAVLAGKSCYLRFTLSALAQISEHFNARGPQALAVFFSTEGQSLPEAKLRLLMFCLLQAEHKRGAQAVSDAASKAELSAAMPIIADLFEKAFQHDQ